MVTNELLLWLTKFFSSDKQLWKYPIIVIVVLVEDHDDVTYNYKIL